MNFVKMNGIGNDYIFINTSKQTIESPSGLAKKLCNRHLSIGADGLVLFKKSAKDCFIMRIFNPDGSEAEMCGNAVRCLGRLLKDMGAVSGNNLSVQTLSGIKHLTVCGNLVSVDMGTLKIVATDTEITYIDAGNPHAVVFRENLAGVENELKSISQNYLGGINAEAVKILTRAHIEMRVWERGAGETLACGTGACAVAFASYKKGLTSSEVIVTLKGGNLSIKINENDSVIMEGLTAYNYFGSLSINDYGKIKRKLQKVKS
ncbi:MAG: diaminopimelate epimerase [Firmicutes bacterium]|nr:diaminopimelate epimerase [Bacillota bacterium]